MMTQFKWMLGSFLVALALLFVGSLSDNLAITSNSETSPVAIGENLSDYTGPLLANVDDDDSDEDSDDDSDEDSDEEEDEDEDDDDDDDDDDGDDDEGEGGGSGKNGALERRTRVTR